MKYILMMKDFDDCKYINLYVDTETMRFAKDIYCCEKGYFNSEIQKFQNEFYENHAPSLLLQRRMDFYKFVEALEKNGYKEIKFIPIKTVEYQ